MGYVLVLCRRICIRSTLSELFVVAILLTVAVNFAVFVISCLFRITFLLTILFDLLCVLNWQIPRSSALVELTFWCQKWDGQTSKYLVNDTCELAYCVISRYSQSGESALFWLGNYFRLRCGPQCCNLCVVYSCHIPLCVIFILCLYTNARTDSQNE